MVLSFLYNELANHGDLLNGHGHRWTPGVFSKMAPFQSFFWCIYLQTITYDSFDVQNMCLFRLKNQEFVFATDISSTCWPQITFFTLVQKQGKPSLKSPCWKCPSDVNPGIMLLLIQLYSIISWKEWWQSMAFLRFSNQEIVFWTI